ncbi:MAG: DNA gyrase inhibitor YacG [Pseudomonadota bacterium]
MSTKNAANIVPLRKPVACANCGIKSSNDHFPFCSQRCKQLDLHHWFSQSYAIATNETYGFEER